MDISPWTRCFRIDSFKICKNTSTAFWGIFSDNVADMFILSVHLLPSQQWKGTKWLIFVIFFTKITRRLHRGTQPVEHQPIESVTVDNDAHFKTHDKTKQSQHVERRPPIEIVQRQMSIGGAALAIQITSLLCFALGCGREKNLDNGFHLPPSQTNHTSIGSTHYSGSCIGNTAAQHCRWQWSRLVPPHHPVCQCQLSPHYLRAGAQRILADWSQHRLNTHTYSKRRESTFGSTLTCANSSPGARCINISHK